MSALLDALRPHLPVLPVLLPAFAAVALLLLPGGTDGPPGRALRLQRAVAMAASMLQLALAVLLLVQADAGTPLVYRVGDWPAPFGIALVVDRLSALMLVLAHLVALPALASACGGWDARGRHFHPLFQFQLMGLAGAFVTGDLFNLFVFFEVLLIASYVLLVHGLGVVRLQVGLHYVVLNLAASALFLVALALVYATTGTLNMADLARRAATVPADAAPVLAAAAALLLVVFGFKAAVAPLHAWLPATYAAAGAPVAALFAIMTKVGLYAIVRVHGAVLGGDAGLAASGPVGGWLLPLAVATSVLGAAGALAAGSLSRLVASLNVASVGTILVGVGVQQAGALSGALFYLVHSTLVVGGLFLLAGLVACSRGQAGDRLLPAGRPARPMPAGLLLVLGAASVAGLPPLPGFLGKVLLMQGAAGTGVQAWVWATLLATGLLALLALVRAGIVVFWAEPVGAAAGVHEPGLGNLRLSLASASLLLGGVAIAALAGPLARFTEATVVQLGQREAYARAVLGDAEASPVRPYDGRHDGPGAVPASPEGRAGAGAGSEAGSGGAR